MRKILFIELLGGIGDVLIALSAIHGLALSYPAAELTVLTFPPGGELLKSDPLIKRVVLAEPAKAKQSVVELLTRETFDLIVSDTNYDDIDKVIQNSGASQVVTNLWRQPPADELVGDRFVKILQAEGLINPNVIKPAQQEAIDLLLATSSDRLSAYYNYILLNPWTSCQSRNYDSQRFAFAARQLAEVTQMPVVVTGVEKDRSKSPSLLATLGDYGIDLIGKTTLSQLAALIANAKLVLTNNTSTMHIADATRTPTVVMFAGTELECQWEPRNGTSRLLRRPTTCSPCYAFTCPYQLECLDIPPEEVVAAGLELINVS